MPSSLRKQVLRPLQSSWLYLRWLDHQIAQLKEEIDALHEQARSQSVLIDRNRQLTQQWKSFSEEAKAQGQTTYREFCESTHQNLSDTSRLYVSEFLRVRLQIQRQENQLRQLQQQKQQINAAPQAEFRSLQDEMYPSGRGTV